MFNRERADRDLDAELRAYVELLTAEKIRAGMPADAARRAALVETGGIEQVKESVRDVRPGVLIETVLQDVRYAGRTLRKAPAFALAAALTLAIGIGASTAIFTMVEGVLLRGLPVGSGDRLLHLQQPSARADNEGFSVLEIKDLDRGVPALAGVAEHHSMSFQLYGHGDPLRVRAGVVSDKFFDMIGVRPLLGRTFRPGEEAVGAPPVVVLSHRFWMEQFNGDPSIVGATFTMNDKVHTVVGVLPPLPGYPNDNDIWMPAGACPFRSAPDMLNARDMRMVDAFAVVRPGVSLEQARAELTAVAARFHAAYPAAYPAAQRLRFTAVGARDEMTARAKPILLMLLATAAFLLIAAAANVANLSLSRQMRRAQELALRVALGAGSGRLYRQLALESLLLTVAGGALGVLLAASGVGVLRSFAATLTPRASEIRLDAGVLAFAFALCVIIALVVAAAPFVHTLGRRNIANALRRGNSGALGTRGDLRLRGALVVAQVAIACVMLVGAGLIGRSLLALQRVDAGIDVRNVLTARLDLSFTKYNTGSKRREAIAALLQRLDALPGISSMAIASALPLTIGMPNDVRFQIDGTPTPPGTRGPHSDATAVSPEYFQAVGIPLLRGRPFTPADRDTLNTPLIISERLAKTYWGGRDPIGTRISVDSGRTWNPVVGVVADVRQRGLDKDVTDEIYYPVVASGVSDLRVFLRTIGPGPSVIKALRGAVHELDPQQPVSSVQTLEQVRGAQLAEPRVTTTLVTAFAVLALLLTATGLAGVIAYGVAQRLPEFAIRIALGANTARILALVMRDGLTIVLVGLAVGLTVSVLASRLITKLLFTVRPTDVSTYVAVGVLIVATAALACLVPSRRGLRADPAQLFRGS